MASNEAGSFGSASMLVTHSRRRVATLSSTGRVAYWRRPFIRLSRKASFEVPLRATPTTQNLSGNSPVASRL